MCNKFFIDQSRKKIRICIESVPIKHQHVHIFYITLHLPEFRIFKEPSPI
jgi:hypothetical protein